MKPVRFKELPIGKSFRIQLAGGWFIAEKTAVDKFTTPKINSPGFVDFKVNPELNEDECFPVYVERFCHD